MEPQTDKIAQAFAGAAAYGLVRLCGLLAAKGMLEGIEIEQIRHISLMSFDEQQKRPDLEPGQKEQLETLRGMYEGNWAKAIEQVPE